MSLESIRLAFQPAADGKTTLTAATLPPVAPLLANLGITSIVIGQARVVTGTSSVTLSGPMAWRGATGTGSIVGSVVGGADRLVFVLDIDAPVPWTIGVAFPDQPGMWRDGDGLGMAQADSYLPSIRVDLPTILADNSPAPARLTGGLPMTGALDPYVAYLGPQPLQLDGTIVFGAAGVRPALVLDALSHDAQGMVDGYTGQPLSGVGLRLSNIVPDTLSLTPGQMMSSLLLLVRLPLNGSTVDLTCPLLRGGSLWPLTADLWTAKPTLSDGISGLAGLFGLPRTSFALPPGVDFLNQFYLGELNLGLLPPPAGTPLPRLQTARAVIGSDKQWAPPIPYVRVANVGSEWQFSFWSAGAALDLGARVWGDMLLGGTTRAVRQPLLFGDRAAMLDVPVAGPAADPLVFRITVDYPTWDVSGRLLTIDGSDTVPLTTVFAAFNFSPPDTGLAVSGLQFAASPRTQAFSAQGSIQSNWTVPIGGVDFQFAELGFWLKADQSAITGGLTALLYIKATGEAAFAVEADYLGANRWTFLGELQGSVELVDLFTGIFGVTPPAWVAGLSISLTALKLGMDTGGGQGGSYDAEGAVVAKWRIDALGADLAIAAAASIRKTPALAVPDRKLAGSFAINKLVVSAGVDLSRGQQTYLFSVRYDTVELIATTANRKKDDGTSYQVLNLQLKGLTLGDILTYFVRLASPASDFRLEPPWDVLDSIDLSNFVLTLDKVKNLVELKYTVDANFGFIDIETVGIRYTFAGKGRVNLILTGRILDQVYGEDDALTWDVVDDPPPAVPGKGPRLLDLRYMGVGQHVSLRDMAQYRTLEQVIGALRREMRQVDDPEESPVGQAQAPELIFDAGSQWMLGFDFTVIDTLRVALVLHDPDLYGILITLDGAKAGSLSGFSFELLYRKVTDDIGVFRVQLKVPDLFRQLEFGAVSITLGVITVEVFTNGNFSVDLGFPHNRSFADSFALQWFPFIGRGGLYFALLTGATSRRVPVITNGNFDPVIELGLGLSVGLGKEIRKGPLNAGLYVEVELIVEGVLAWFHPSDAAVPSDRYFWIQGTAGITGKLYGAVDFKIIKVSVSVTLHAYAMVTIEAYKATVIDLEVGVEAEASIKIWFVRISFSFSFTLHETFTIGKDTRPPWTLAGNQPGGTGARLAFGGAVPARRRGFRDVVLHTRAAYLGALHAARPHLEKAMADDGYILDWNADLQVFGAGVIRPVVLRLVVLPAIDGVTMAFAPAQPAENPTPDYRVSIVLTADSGDDGDAAAQRRATAALSAHAADVPDLSLNVLIEGFLRWALDALPDHPVTDTNVLAGQIDVLLEQLKDSRVADAGFAMANLSTFLSHNFALRVCLPPPGGVPAALSGASFPMPPPVAWTSTAVGRDRNFAAFNMVGPAYEQLLASYFAALDPSPPATPAPSPANDNGATESVASFVFRDAMLMLTKSAIEEAQTLMRAWPYATTQGQTLAQMCDAFEQVDVQYLVHAGDTVDQVAAQYGLSSAELVWLNADIAVRLRAAAVNTALRVKLGVTPIGISLANAGAALAANPALPIGDLVAQVRAAPVPQPPVVPPPVAETLAALAQRFGKTAAQVATGDTLASARLLRPGAPLAVGTIVYANPDALTLAQAAAVLFVRLNGVDAVPAQGYQVHAQLIAENNPALFDVDVDTILAVATVALSAGAGDVWQVQAGDTLARIAAVAALLREPPPAAYTAFAEAVLAANPAHAANPVKLPATAATAIVPDETIASLALRLLQADPPPVVALITGADVLRPLAVVVVPAVSLAVTATDTFGGIAASWGLSIEQLAGRLAAQSPLFDGAPELTVAHVPAVAIDRLVDTLQRSHAAVRISGMISNFLMHGLRPPAPGGDQAPAALHAIIGQQIAPDVAAPMTLTLAAPAASSWLQYYCTAVSLVETIPAFATRNGAVLADVLALNPGASARYGTTDPMPAGLVLITAAAKQAQTAVSQAETLTALAARVAVPLARIEALNPAVAAQYGADTPMPAGLVLVTAAATAAIVVDHAQLVYPDAKVQLPTVRAPVAMPLARQVPVTYGLQQHLVWQAGVNPWNTGAANASPSLWPFPAGLSAGAQISPAQAYALVANAVQPGATAPMVPTHYSWATQVDIAIRRTSVPRLDGGTDGDLANTYEVIGADTAGRQLLLDLWQNLPASGGADLYLLHAPSQQSDRATGLASAVLDPLRTFVVKANLSTETASGRALSLAVRANTAMPIEGADFAQIDAPKSFVTLLWECSVVGGGGFVLGYAATDGSGLPDWLFGAEGNATIALLAIPRPQAAPLKPWFNCVAIGDNVDASTVSLAVIAADRSETIAQPTVMPGNIGFDCTLSNPDFLAGQTPGQQFARQSYAFAGYSLGGTPAFRASDGALQVGPQAVDPDAPATGVRAPRDPANWYYHQVVPISRFAKTYAAPAQARLPAPALDPYAGIAALWTRENPQPAKASIAIWFQDLIGNIGNPGAAGLATVTPMVGYTDPLKGVAQWPNVATGYQVAKQGDGARLAVAIGIQLSACLPGPGDIPAAAVASAASQRATYRSIHFQLAQPDVAATLTSNLAMTKDAHGVPVPIALDGGLPRLRAMAAANYVFLDLIAGPSDAEPGLAPLFADIGASASLNAIVTDYGFATDDGDTASGYQLLARANAAAPLSAMLWGTAPPAAATISLPAFAIVTEGASFARLFASQADAVAALSLPENTHLPLRAGQTLVIPAITKPVAGAATATLFQVAQALAASPIDLAAANADATGALRAGFAFEYLGVTARVGLGGDGKTVSLQAIADAYVARGQPVSASDLAVFNQYGEGMFADEAVLRVASYIVQPADTVAANGAALSVADLVAGNFDAPNVFDTGVPIHTGLRTGVVVPAGQPLDQFAAAQGLTAVQLLQSLGGFALTAGSRIMVPGAARWTHAAPMPAPYCLRAGDTLATIAAAFGVGEEAVAVANADLPGVLTDLPITVQAISVVPAKGASFNSVVAQFAVQKAVVTVAQIAGAVAGVAGHLVSGGLLICPLTTLGSGSAGLTLAAIATRYGVSASAFAAANAAMPGLILPGVPISVAVNGAGGGADLTVSTTTRANDTFNSLAARLAAMGAPAGVTTIAGANAAAALINPAVAAAMPPVPVALSGDFGPGADGWLFGQPIFAIEVALTLSRARALVDPGFVPVNAGDPPTPVESASTSIAPASSLSPDQTAAIGTPLRLEQFAAALEAGVPAIRVANGKVLVGGTTGRDLWAVVFGKGGIEALTVAPTFDAGQPAKPTPWSFAIRPLSTDLVSAARLRLKPLVDGALSPVVTPTDISGVDIEDWARLFLGDFDRLLSPAYAAGLYRTASLAVRSRIDELVGCKAILANGIAAGLDFVLVAGSLDPRRRASAAAMLRQRLLASLASGYAISTVLQWDVTAIRSGWTTASVKLTGAPVVRAGGAANVSIGTTKITLADAASPGADPYVNAALTVTNAQAVGALTFDAAFVPGEIEFDIAAVPGVTGYASSNWLRFVNPLDTPSPPGYAVDLGTVVAPLPLRSYPAMPQLQAQTTPAQDADATTVAAAAAWRYVVDTGHAAVLQDELGFDIEVNLRPPAGRLAMSNRDVLVAALAQYVHVRSDLWALLEAIPAAQPDQPPAAALVAAIGTFIDLAGTIAHGWVQRWAAPLPALAEAGDPPGGPVYARYALSSRLDAVQGVLQSLTLTGDAAAPGPGGWPEMWIGRNGQPPFQLDAQPAVGNRRTYTFPAAPPVPAAAELTFELRFPGLASGLYHNARTAAAVVRNAHLMPDPGPATREAFVYRTPFLTFADKATPLVTNGNRLPIASFTAADHGALTRMFADILGGPGTGLQISVAVNYNYRLAEAGIGIGDPLAPSLPVLLMPRSIYTAALPGQLATSLLAWQAANDPSKTGGEWQFSVSLYSAVEPALDRPVLRLERIISPLPA